MVAVEEAMNVILGAARDFGEESVELAHATGRVLRENLVADRDMPPFDRVTMDGIALKHEALAGNSSFKIAGVAAAGSPPRTLKQDQDCIEVMTGAMLPVHADTVIRYEDLDIHEGHAQILVDSVKKGQNVHKQGEDQVQGATVVRSGTTIGTPEIGVAASLGKSVLKVTKLPKVAIISTGDELVDIHETPEPYQIRKSNVHKILAGLQDEGVRADLYHLADDYKEVLNGLKYYLNNYDVLLLSGAVSKGKFDYLPQALEELGVNQLFHRVSQRPGKPFWFGSKEEKCTIFAFPGNPVSSFMCFTVYFLPWLHQSTGKRQSQYPYALLESDVSFTPDLTYFLEVKIRYSDRGQILASPVIGHGSGDFANLVRADAFIRLPKGKNLYKAGEAYPIVFFRP